MNRTITALFVCSLLFTACSAHTDVHESPLKGDSTISLEINRLASLTQAETVTESDFERLETLVASDPDAADEVEEIVTMVHYGEYVHAGHGLGFLSSYVESGTHALCPGHSLAHYYVFTKHGETQKARESLAEAKEQLPEWEEKAESYSAQFPGTQDFETMDANIRNRLAAIAVGDNNASDEDTIELAELLCVEE